MGLAIALVLGIFGAGLIVLLIEFDMLGPGLVVLAVLALIIVPFTIYRHARYNSLRTVTFSITRLPDRDQQYNANGNKNTYANLVYTDKGTFENVDSIFPWKQNSSDLYGQLLTGKKWTCEVAGWRAGFLSNYPDLIKCSKA